MTRTPAPPLAAPHLASPLLSAHLLDRDVSPFLALLSAVEVTEVAA